VPASQQEVAAEAAVPASREAEVLASSVAVLEPVVVLTKTAAQAVPSLPARVSAAAGSLKCRAMAVVPASAPSAMAAVAVHCRSGLAMDLGRPSLRPASGKLSASSSAAVDLRSHRAAAVRGIWASRRQPARQVSATQVSAVMPLHRVSATESEMGSEKPSPLWRPRAQWLRLQASVIQVSAVTPSHRVKESEMGSEKASPFWRQRVQELRRQALQVQYLQLQEPQAKGLQALASASRQQSELLVALLVACGSPRPERAVWPVELVEDWG